jgi:pyruvate dehydrogenase E2 component (dihydrolipoamide acetyltransferase)
VVPIGAAIAVVGTKDEKIDVPSTPAAPTPVSDKPAPPTAAGEPSAAVAASLAPVSATQEVVTAKASPLAKRVAGESKVDLGKIRGTGPGGRIVRKDVEAALSQGAGKGGGAAQFPLHSIAAVSRDDTTVPLTKLRQAIARRMTESKSSVPHFYVTHEYGVDSLVNLREQANAVLGGDEKLSVNDFVVRAVAMCLREFPNLNSAYKGDHVLRRGAVNVGVAVAVEGGLLTVVCRDADQKPVRQISAELKAMAGRARSGKVHPSDIEGSTFTVSNLGMFDVENFSAIISPPEAGILAVGSARQIAVVEKGEIRAGWRMKATIAVDHRVSDGAEAAQFMQALAKYIETPLSLFL